MQADRETAEDRARQCFPLHSSWRPLCSLPSGGNATTEQESGHHQHTSIIGSSWVVPNRTQGGVLRAGCSHPDILQQLACLLVGMPSLYPASLPPTQATTGQGRGRGSPWIRAQELLSCLPPSPEVVMNCRETLLRGVRTISIKHNFLMKRLRGSPVELIRIECSLKFTPREGARGQGLGSTWCGLEGWAPGAG